MSHQTLYQIQSECAPMEAKWRAIYEILFGNAVEVPEQCESNCPASSVECLVMATTYQPAIIHSSIDFVVLRFRTPHRLRGSHG